MKANRRCKEHNQGDRCRLESGHEGNHEGNFAVWLGPNVVKLYEVRSRRNRVEERKERDQKTFLEGLKKQIRLMVLLKEYTKSFTKKPEESNVVRAETVHASSITEHE